MQGYGVAVVEVLVGALATPSDTFFQLDSLAITGQFACGREDGRKVQQMEMQGWRDLSRDSLAQTSHWALPTETNKPAAEGRDRQVEHVQKIRAGTRAGRRPYS